MGKIQRKSIQSAKMKCIYCMAEKKIQQLGVWCHAQGNFSRDFSESNRRLKYLSTKQRVIQWLDVISTL